MDDTELVINNFIDGKFVPPLQEAWIPNYEPATGKVYGKIPDSQVEDVNLAVVAAQKAFPVWSGLSKEERAAYLYKLADLIDKNKEELVAAESKDNGKPLSTARMVDIPRAAYNFRFFAGHILHHEDMSTTSPETGTVNYTVSQPVGVIGLISPWNLPLYLLTWKIAPCIAVGNTCVAKPSELTSATASILARLIQEAGIPNGVVNLVFGLGASCGQAIVEHPDICRISFTGGTATGRILMNTASKSLKPLSLELGGKNPNIIFDDCNLDLCVATTVRSSFANQGEICLCGSRIYVQQGIYDKFIEKFIAAIQSWKVGDPLEPTTNMGALISLQHRAKVLSYVDKAKEEGGKILCGGAALQPEGRCAEGYFVGPTVITEIDQKSVCVQEEIFGPVVTVIKFESEAEVIALANDVKYGLSATVWTENLGRAQRLSLALQTGTVWVNCWMNRDLRVPFGGAKMSGIGAEGGKFSMDFYTQKKTVCLQHSLK